MSVLRQDLRYEELKENGQPASGPQAGEATGEIDHERVKDSREEVRLEALEASEAMAKGAPEEEQLSELKEKLRDLNMYVRSDAADALAQMGKKAAPALPDLRRALKDSHETVRLSASYALGAMGKEAAPAIPELKEALTSWHTSDPNSDPYEQRRKGAAYALGRIGQEVPDLVLPYLRAILREDNGQDLYVSYAAIQALEIMGLAASEAIPELRKVVRIGNKENRIKAIKTLKVMEATEAIPELEQALFDDDHDIGEAAAEALGSMGKKAKEALPSLVKAMRWYLWNDTARTHWRVGASAVEALSAMGEEAAPAIPELRKVAASKSGQEGQARLAKKEAGKALQAIGEAANLNSMCCCINRECYDEEMGSTGLWAVDHSGRCCKVYTDQCTRGFKSLLKKAPEVQPDFQACGVGSASWLKAFMEFEPRLWPRKTTLPWRRLGRSVREGSRVGILQKCVRFLVRGVFGLRQTFHI